MLFILAINISFWFEANLNNPSIICLRWSIHFEFIVLFFLSFLSLVFLLSLPHLLINISTIAYAPFESILIDYLYIPN